MENEKRSIIQDEQRGTGAVGKRGPAGLVVAVGKAVSQMPVVVEKKKQHTQKTKTNENKKGERAKEENH